MEPNPRARTDHSAIITRACRRMESADEAPSLEALADEAGLSPGHFHRVFREATGVTPKSYAAAVRAGRIRELLAGGRRVTEAIYAAGYGSSGRFYAEADSMLGMKPSRVRAGGQGETIRFGIGQGSLGAVLVAATVRGVCRVALGDDPGALLHDLEDRFPKARLVGGDDRFESWMAAVIGLVEGSGQGIDLPLDIRGTAFQKQVWDALRAVPIGATVSYAELARRIGRPSGIRAVANACGANPVAVAIPCHRVVRSDGGLGGYRWGVDRKRALLAREGSCPAP